MSRSSSTARAYRAGRGAQGGRPPGGGDHGQVAPGQGALSLSGAWALARWLWRGSMRCLTVRRMLARRRTHARTVPARPSPRARTRAHSRRTEAGTTAPQATRGGTTTRAGGTMAGGVGNPAACEAREPLSTPPRPHPSLASLTPPPTPSLHVLRARLPSRPPSFSRAPRSPASQDIRRKDRSTGCAAPRDRCDGQTPEEQDLGKRQNLMSRRPADARVHAHKHAQRTGRVMLLALNVVVWLLHSLARPAHRRWPARAATKWLRARPCDLRRHLRRHSGPGAVRTQCTTNTDTMRSRNRLLV